MKRILSRTEIPADVLEKVEAWQAKRRDFDPAREAATLYAIFQEVQAIPEEEWQSPKSLQTILLRYPRQGKGLYSKASLIAGYRHLVAEGDLAVDPLVEQRIRMKPMRTQSGVAPVTVLTAPAGCPGKCIFCPDDWRMPKSYLYDEPGCQRAERDGFDPFQQTLGRIQSFESIGHDASKVELLILGGTWSAYSRDYREWFVQRCFDAMNAAGEPAQAPSSSLVAAQSANVTASHRNVGLVIETRPDWITPEEIVHLRMLGVTKVQIGVQSLDDEILALNRRGHDVSAVRRALGLLRTAGFKLHLHWMPNLYGATPAKDRVDFARFFEDPALRPDELKIYPCSLIAETDDPPLHPDQPTFSRYPCPPYSGGRQAEQSASGCPRRAGASGPALRLYSLPRDPSACGAARPARAAGAPLRHGSDRRILSAVRHQRPPCRARAGCRVFAPEPATPRTGGQPCFFV